VRDQARCYRWHPAGTSFIEHDRDLANADDPDGITNGNAKSNAGKDSAPRIKIDLRTGATVPSGGKTWNSTRVGQLSRFVRRYRACRCSPNATLDRQFIPRRSGRFRTSRVAFGTRAGVESGCTNYV
jgi:hypothetical protein